MVAITLAALVMQFVQRHKLGICGGEGGGVLTARDPDTVRAPDFCFVSNARLPVGRIPRRYYPPSPDLAVEVMSPSDRFTTLYDKALEYLAGGSRLVWLILPGERAAMVFHPGQQPRTLHGDALLDGEDVLPGFAVALPVLWAGMADED